MFERRCSNLPSLGKRIRTAAVAVGATMALGAGLFAGLAPTPGVASSHREAPLTAADPQIDGTDLYAFVSPDAPKTVTIISNWVPFEEPAGGPNFYSFAPGVHYDINIDNNGDARPDIVYRWIFANHYRNTDSFLYNTGQVTSLTDPDLNFYQTYDLHVIRPGSDKVIIHNAVVAPVDVGDASMPDYPSLSDAAIIRSHSTTCMGCKFWTGQADDPFFLDLRVFDLLYGLNLSETGHDTLAGFNVHSFAMQVPKSALAAQHDPSANPVIGIWTTAERQSVRVQNPDGSVNFSGDYVQVSRLGSPLVNEVVVPVGLKDHFNASQPKDDAQFAPKVLTFGNDPNDLPALINAIYGIPIPDSDPNTPGVQRSDLGEVFLTGIPDLTDPHLDTGIDQSKIQASEELRLNMSIPPCTSSCSTLGVVGGDLAGYPNGRRLTDDIVDESLQVVEGVLLGQSTGLGDGVPANDVAFLPSFPYLAYPHSGSATNPHGSAIRKQ
jgi:Domain of unknown function (DUF4331)